jgi:hypothetical protein
MAALKEPVKIFIVQSLACFETPQQVVEAVKQEYNVEITRQQVAFMIQQKWLVVILVKTKRFI